MPAQFLDEAQPENRSFRRMVEDMEPDQATVETEKIVRAFFLAMCAISGVTAAPRTVTLDVRNMTCPVCPLTVKKALERVPGVRHVTVDYASKAATVQFDDATATADALTTAIQAAGYPSTVKKDGI